MRENAGKALLALAFFSASCVAGPVHAVGAAGYRILARYGHPGGAPIVAVQVDSAARRIYIAEGDRVRVLNADTGAALGDLPVPNPRGVALAPGERRGFVTSGSGNSVTMFDSATLKVVKVIPLAGKRPGAPFYDPGTGRVFVAETGGAVTAIEARSGRVISTLRLEGKLGSMVSNDYGELFVAAEDKDAIHVVDTEELKFLGDFPVEPGCGPGALTLDPRGRRLFAACRNGRLQIIDTDIGLTFEELPIGTGKAHEAFTFLPQGEGGWKGATFVAASDGALTFVRMDAFIHYSVGGMLRLEPGIGPIAYDPQTHHILLSAGSVLLVVGP
jgi:PQQ-like domain